jgi:hypothetical protein
VVRLARNVLVVAPLLFALYVFLQPQESRAVPLFARKYGLQCTTCHFAFPRLNKFGMDFRQRGYRMPGDKGSSPWDDKEFPLSFVGNVGYSYNSVDTMTISGSRERTATSGFVQNDVEFQSAGTLAPNVSFHFDDNFTSAGGPLNSGQAFVQFDDLASDGKINVRAGIFDADIPYLASSRRTTQTDYLSPITLDGEGVELNGTRSGWTYAAGLVNSDRTTGKPTDKTLNNFENTYVWLMRDIRNYEITARWYADHQDPRKPDVSSSLHTQVDVSAFVDIPNAQIIPGYTYEKFSDQPAENEVQIGLLEALVKFGGGGRWLATGRVELQHVSKTDLNPVEDLTLSVLNVAYMVNPNVRVAGEWSHGHDNVQGPRTDAAHAYVHVAY